MAALSMPMATLVLNARLNGVTFLTQEGSGFASTSTVTLEDQNPTDPYTFLCENIEDTNKRLLVKVTCTAVPANTSRRTKVKLKVTTGATVDETGPFPVILSTRQIPQIHQASVPRARLRLKATAKSVLFIPGTGFGEFDDVIPCEVVRASRGTWEVVKARQKVGRVKVTLKCLTTTIVMSAGGTSTSTISLTLSPNAETTIDVQPIDVEYIDDPDEDPE